MSFRGKNNESFTLGEDTGKVKATMSDDEDYPVKLKTFSSARVGTPQTTPSSTPRSSLRTTPSIKRKQEQEEIVLSVTSFSKQVRISYMLSTILELFYAPHCFGLNLV